MKFSYQWLKQWVDIRISAEELADRLTAGGLEVDSVEAVAAPFEGVVVGRISRCEPHPDADKLKLCEVDSGQGEPVQVVCGAPNAREGMKMPFARVGAVLGDEFKIKKAKLRGVESHGMCCSAKELGLSDDHSGLMELPSDAPLGEDVRTLLGLDDVTIDVDLTPNRADCLGIRGLARDVSAICNAPYTPVVIPAIEASIDDTLDIRLEDPQGCPRYAGRVIRGVDATAPTPLWMIEALRRCGVRSISIVVDITNYVMLELGQPMHAFDLDKLQGGIIVRRGKSDEQLLLLDDKEVTLDESLVTICDHDGPVALGGIMGGLGSSVTDQTTNIFLESAWFEPSVISGKARSLGMHTDASHRFERGVDPQGQGDAIERMTALVLEFAGGHAGPLSIAEIRDHLPRREAVVLRHDRLLRVLGSPVEAGEVDGIFERLGMKADFDKGQWSVTPPSARFDIEIEEDLVEEVARIHGYDSLQARLPGGEISLRKLSEKEVPDTRIRDALCDRGYFEAINYSFVDRRLLATLRMDENAFALANPISSDMDVMRTSLVPGLLTSLRRNVRRQHQRVRLFETGVAFINREQLEEQPMVAAVACGAATPEQWGTDKRDIDFFDLKHDVETLLALRGPDEYAYRTAELPWLHPGQSASLWCGEQALGWLGVLHPGILSELDIRQQVLAFELDLNVLKIREIPYTKNISPYPSVRRDLAFLLPESVKYDELKNCVQNSAGELLKEMLIFDVFSGQNVEKGYKSLAIGLILQDVSCTLTDEVVDSVMSKIIRALTERLNAQHRG